MSEPTEGIVERVVFADTVNVPVSVVPLLLKAPVAFPPTVKVRLSAEVSDI